MPDEVTPPILVPASAVPDTVLLLIRSALTALGGSLLVKRGLLTDADLQNLIGALLVIVPTIYGAWLTRRNNAKQQTMAGHLPDAIAQVKS